MCTGGGKLVSLVLSGWNRLFLRDPERECRVQAATFLTAYLLGLPCFCFSPNVLEVMRMVESPSFQGVLGSVTGLQRLLVYLLAPVAAENTRHQQLIVSDPRQARALVKIFQQRNPGMLEDEEAEVLSRWAFHEAKDLLIRNSGLLEKLRRRMESGGATVGDCVLLLEGAGLGGSKVD